jgi:hypothetical protein
MAHKHIYPNIAEDVKRFLTDNAKRLRSMTPAQAAEWASTVVKVRIPRDKLEEIAASLPGFAGFRIRPEAQQLPIEAAVAAEDSLVLSIENRLDAPPARSPDPAPSMPASPPPATCNGRPVNGKAHHAAALAAAREALGDPPADDDNLLSMTAELKAMRSRLMVQADRVSAAKKDLDAAEQLAQEARDLHQQETEKYRELCQQRESLATSLREMIDQY